MKSISNNLPYVLDWMDWAVLIILSLFCTKKKTIVKCIFFLRKYQMSVQSQTQLLPVILALRRLWQKLSSDLKVNLGYTPSTKPTRVIYHPAKTNVLLYR